MSSDSEDAINEAELLLCCGSGCCNVTLYTTAPQCIGCSGKVEACCCVERFCCKLGTAPLLCDKPMDSMCQLGIGCCSIGCRKPRTCCMEQAQLCCYVVNMALPPTDEVPCTLAVCGLVCFPTVGCCKTFGEIIPMTAIIVQQPVVQHQPIGAPMQKIAS